MARRRRVLAAVLAGLAVLLAVTAARQVPAISGGRGPASTGPAGAAGPAAANAGTTPVLVAARELPAGAVLAGADLRRVAYPAALAPAHALTAPAQALGRRLVLPVHAGEPLTDLRLLAGGLLQQLSADSGGTALVAAPVRIADAGEVTLVDAGDRVDVLAVPAQPVPGSATTSGEATPGATGAVQPGDPVVRDATVLAVPGRPAAAAAADGGLILLAVTSQQAADLAAAAATGRLSLVLHG